MQIFIHCKPTLHVSGVTAPIIRSIKNCTRSLWYRSYYLYRRLRVQFLVLLMMGAVTPETCRVGLQWINICILMHLLDFYSHWITMHATTSLPPPPKKKKSSIRRQTNHPNRLDTACIREWGVGVRTAEPQLGIPAEVLWFFTPFRDIRSHHITFSTKIIALTPSIQFIQYLRMNTVCQCNHLHQLQSRQHHSETIKPSIWTVNEAAKTFKHIYEMREIQWNKAMYGAYL